MEGRSITPHTAPIEGMMKGGATKKRQATPLLWHIFLLFLFLWTVSILCFIQNTKAPMLTAVNWSIAQCLIPWPFSSTLGRLLQEHAWKAWERNDDGYNKTIIIDCPVLDLSEKESIESVAESLEAKYGADWRAQPLLLRRLWSRHELENASRRLSLSGLLQENLSIPYFINASAQYALSPDGKAPVASIVKNMTLGHKHKIGTQFLVEAYPKLIEEVAPTNIVTALFGDYFTPSHIVSGPFGLFPAMTTVPVFVAKTGSKTTATSSTTDTNDKETCADVHPRTDLHCEPIGNVAVQLRGEKQWILVEPQYSFRINPAAAPDGRAFFASFSKDLRNVPQYQVTTRAGDALWIPTWTWHRVDYVGEEEDVAIGGSLFHFRAIDFVRNNPLFAMLIIPSLIKELVGYNTQ